MLEQLPVSPGQGVQFVVAAVPALLLLWLGVQAPLRGGRPRAYESALIVCGLLLFALALLRLAKLLGADFSPLQGAMAWTAALEAVLAASISARRRSAIAALIAAVALVLAVLSTYNALFEPFSATPFRWLLLALALGFGLASLPLRAISLRHAEQMINAAGLSIATIALLQGGLTLGAPHLPGFWEFVMLAAGCGLVAYAGADRAPGPAYVGALCLLAFVLAVSSGDTLKWWPLTLLGLGAVVLAAGLRPRAPLPPEPEAYRAGDLPLAVRSDSDVSVRVERID